MVSESSPNNTTSVPPITGVTQVELWIQLIVFFGLLSLINVLGNCAIAVGIVRSKQLRTRFFVMLWFVVVARAMLSFQFMILCVYRSLRTLNMLNVNMKRSYCYLFQVLAYYSSTVEMVILVGMVIDRILAIAAFKYYRTLNYQQAITSCAVATGVTVAVKIIPSLIGVDFGATIACLNSVSPLGDAYRAFHLNTDVPFALGILLLQIGLILYIRFWYVPFLKSTMADIADQSEAFKSQKRLVIVLRRIVFIHCGLTLVNKACGILTNMLPPEVGYRFFAIASVVNCIDIFVNMIVVLSSNDQLMRASFPWWRKTTVAVTPSSQGNTGGQNKAIQKPNSQGAGSTSGRRENVRHS